MAAYCLDEAASLFGMVIENALLEVDEVRRGEKTERKPRYTLSQLLEPDFRLPRRDEHGDMSGPIVATADGALMVDEVN